MLRFYLHRYSTAPIDIPVYKYVAPFPGCICAWNVFIFLNSELLALLRFPGLKLRREFRPAPILRHLNGTKYLFESARMNLVDYIFENINWRVRLLSFFSRNFSALRYSFSFHAKKLRYAKFMKISEVIVSFSAQVVRNYAMICFTECTYPFLCAIPTGKKYLWTLISLYGTNELVLERRLLISKF